MKTGVLATLLLLVASSAFAQVPVYSNATLGQPQPSHTITPEEYQSLVAHQFVCACGMPRLEIGEARVSVAGFTTQPLPPTYPLQPPFYQYAYVGGYHGVGFYPGVTGWQRPTVAPIQVRSVVEQQSRDQIRGR